LFFLLLLHFFLSARKKRSKERTLRFISRRVAVGCFAVTTPNSLRSDRGCHGRKSASRYFSGSKVNAESFSFARLRRAGSLPGQEEGSLLRNIAGSGKRLLS